MKQALLFTLLILVIFTTAATAWERTYGGVDEDWATSIALTSDGGYIVAGVTVMDVWVLKLNAHGDTLWTRTYGGTGGDGASSIVPTSDGGYIVAGITESFGAGGYDAWVLKLNASGDTLWTRTYGGRGYQSASSIVPTSDGGYVVAGDTSSSLGIAGDAWVLKLDASGDTLWTRTYGGAYADIASSIVPTSDGGYIIAGTTNISGRRNDAWIFKLNASGEVLWSHSYGGDYNDYASSIVPTSDGGYIVAGGTSSSEFSPTLWVLKLNASGDTLWTQTYRGGPFLGSYSIVPTSDGGYILAGFASIFDARGEDAWILKLNAYGDTLWTRTYGGTNDDEARCIVTTPDGGYIVAGFTESFGAGGYDAWVLKLDSRGYSAIESPSSGSPEIGGIKAFIRDDHLALQITMPHADRVRLDLVNLAGETVAPILDRELPAGESRVEVKCPDLPSGVYLVRSDGTLPTARVVVW